MEYFGIKDQRLIAVLNRWEETLNGRERSLEERFFALILLSIAGDDPVIDLHRSGQMPYRMLIHYQVVSYDSPCTGPNFEPNKTKSSISLQSNILLETERYAFYANLR
jgi:hypothetical protein